MGKGDYTRERDQWLGDLTIEQIVKEAREAGKVSTYNAKRYNQELNTGFTYPRRHLNTKSRPPRCYGRGIKRQLVG
ncbi:MAG: hypothetical protein D9V47_11430 [Clostridia bacterium]|nr:MAG: hypothetical protein D9V47_11430 [Clostridia bacterium]